MKRRTAIAGFCLLVLSVAVPAAANDADTLRQARGAYYSLETRGFSGLRCDAALNWELVLADAIKSNPTGAEKWLAVLRQIKFTVATSGTGTTKVTHNEVAAANEREADSLQQIYGAMALTMSGFFDTWSLFVISSPFPAVDGDYRLQQQGGQTVLTYKEGNAGVTTTMDKDFAIKTLVVVAPDFTSTVRPQVAKTAQGYLMKGYQGDYAGKTAADAVKLAVRIAYQEVKGMQIPNILNFAGTSGGAPFKTEVALTSCQITKR